MGKGKVNTGKETRCVQIQFHLVPAVYDLGQSHFSVSFSIKWENDNACFARFENEYK